MTELHDYTRETYHKPKIIYSAWNAELLNSFYVLLAEMAQLCLKLEKEIAVEKGLQCALRTVKEQGLKSMLTIWTQLFKTE